MTVPEKGRPRPHPSAISEPFWEGCQRHELLLQHCEDCSAVIFYPRPTCPICGSLALRFRPASGRGTLYTYTVARRPTHPLLAGRVPYVIAVVELEEGPRMTSTVVDCDVEELQIGGRLTVDFEDLGELSVPVFRTTPKLS